MFYSYSHVTGTAQKMCNMAENEKRADVNSGFPGFAFQNIANTPNN